MKVTLCYLVVICKSVLIEILGRFFLETLDVMDSPVHLKVTYRNNVRKLILLEADLKTATHICDAILRNLLAITMVPEEALGGVNMVDIDVHRDEIRKVPYGDFEVIQLDKNPDQSKKYGQTSL